MTLQNSSISNRYRNNRNRSHFLVPIPNSFTQQLLSHLWRLPVPLALAPSLPFVGISRGSERDDYISQVSRVSHNGAYCLMFIPLSIMYDQFTLVMEQECLCHVMPDTGCAMQELFFFVKRTLRHKAEYEDLKVEIIFNNNQEYRGKERSESKNIQKRIKHV